MSLVPKPFHELLKMHFIIPPYQRGYRWESRQVEELLDDLLDFVKSLKSKRNRNNEGREPYYCLQPIAVVSHPKNVDTYFVVDGQQRLTTIYILLHYLSKNSDYDYPVYEFSLPSRNIQNEYLAKLEFMEDDNKYIDNIDNFYVKKAYSTIVAWFSRDGHDRYKGKIRDIFAMIPDEDEEQNDVRVIWYEISSKEAHRAFRELNYGKIPLTSTELVKALLLQERNTTLDSVITLFQKWDNSCVVEEVDTDEFNILIRFVNRDDPYYYCFGCGAGGNVFTFIMEYENYSFVEALKFLAQRAGVELPQEEYSKEAKERADTRSALLEMNKLAAKYYYAQLKTEGGRQAREYLQNRQLSQETITAFGLGYSSKYSDDLFRYLKMKGYSEEMIIKAGLVNVDEKHGVYDKFWNRVMFPIMDVNNRVIGFGGRVMGDGKPKYLNSPETLIFDKSRNLYGLHRARTSRKPYFIVCEGYMDVISLHQAGFTNAVASLGTALTCSIDQTVCE